MSSALSYFWTKPNARRIGFYRSSTTSLITADTRLAVVKKWDTTVHMNVANRKKRPSWVGWDGISTLNTEKKVFCLFSALHFRPHLVSATVEVDVVGDICGNWFTTPVTVNLVISGTLDSGLRAMNPKGWSVTQTANTPNRITQRPIAPNPTKNMDMDCLRDWSSFALDCTVSLLSCVAWNLNELCLLRGTFALCLLVGRGFRERRKHFL